MKLLKLKDVNIAQWLIVMVMLGFFVVAILPNEIFGIKLKKTMPKTYEYIVSKRNFLSAKYVCKKDKNTDEIVSDEMCYNKMRVFNNCKNEMYERYAYLVFYRLLPLVENEQQANTIINKCKTYKQEKIKDKISRYKLNKEGSHKNDREINNLLNGL